MEELAHRAQLPVERVMERLQEIERHAQNIEIGTDELAQLLRESAAKLFLLDVREPWEYQIGHLPGSHLMAETDLAQIFEGLKELTVITICHHGIRSLSAALYLREAGLPRVRSLAGGLDLWSQVIDPAIPRYS